MRTPAPAPAIAVSIDELRLTGFGPHGRNELGDRVAAELQHLISTPGWRGGSDIDIDRLDIGRVMPGATREKTARHIAQRIYAQIEARMREATDEGN
jgi:hypothetical protein